MQSVITTDDVLASYKLFGYIFEADLKKFRDLKKLNPKSQYDATYISLLFKHVNGKLMKPKIEFSEQLISSSAKKPQNGGGEDEKDNNKDIPKYMNISFNRLDRETVSSGDYVPKKKDSDSDQLVEDKRVSDNIDRYLENNEKFLNVLDIIDKSYKHVCEELKKQESTLEFRLKKDRKQTDVVVYSIKQASRLDKETNKDVELDNPIYRVKLPVCKKENFTGRIGIWSSYGGEFKSTVFDARKMTSKNNYQAVPATVETIISDDARKKFKKQGVKVYNRVADGVKQYYILENLDFNNADKFITYKSLVGGTLYVEGITSSKFGLSLSVNFFDLYVFKHKTKEVQNNAKEIAIKMRKCMNEEEEDADKIDEDDDASNEEKNEDSEDEDDNTNEPIDSDA